ncbi:MAG: hypothetical protein AAF196_06140 [Planctomycetota bacterium]
MTNSAPKTSPAEETAIRLRNLEFITGALAEQSAAVLVLAAIHEKRQRAEDLSEAEEAAASAAIQAGGQIAQRFIAVQSEAKPDEAAQAALRDES